MWYSNILYILIVLSVLFGLYKMFIDDEKGVGYASFIFAVLVFLVTLIPNGREEKIDESQSITVNIENDEEGQVELKENINKTESENENNKDDGGNQENVDKLDSSINSGNSNLDDLNDTYVKNVINISPQQLIEQHIDTILEKKAEYTDIRQIENHFVNLRVMEKAGEYSYISKDSNELISRCLGSKFIPSATIIILDYETDEIIYSLISDIEGEAIFYPEDKREFYFVVITYDYQLYVSEPIRLIGELDLGFQPNFIDICLSKPFSIYTPQFQIQINARDTSKTILNYFTWSNRDIDIKCLISDCSNHEEFRSYGYIFDTNDYGIVSVWDYPCYFKLNTQYVLDVSLLEIWDKPYVTIDGSITNTNIIELYIDYDSSMK